MTMTFNPGNEAVMSVEANILECTTDTVVLVDENDNAIGTMEKMEAHRNGGHLHRAFSIFVFNDFGQVLLQKRADEKYHFGGLWANTCCSHPRPGEDILVAGRRRLREELGLVCELQEQFSFIYRAEDECSGLSEFENDHVLTGHFQGGELCPNPKEVADWKWMTLDQLNRDIEIAPQIYTKWLKIAVEKLLLDSSAGL